MRRLALVTVAAATAYAAQSGADVGAARNDLAGAMGTSQNLKGLLANQLDVEAVRNLDSEQLGALCSSAASSGSSNQSEMAFSVAADGMNVAENDARMLLQQRCSRIDAPVLRLRSMSIDETGIPGLTSSSSKSKQRSVLCKLLEKGDKGLNKNFVGKVAEAIGFADPLSSTANIFKQNCGQRGDHPHPNPSNPNDYKKVKPDKCQAALPTYSDGTFDLPDGCGEGPRRGYGQYNPGRPGRGLQSQYSKGNQQSNYRRDLLQAQTQRLRRWLEAVWA
ncbi:hypothetical protein HIM_00516 [Hirsutella minnesotensis 3608]|nr:hypothetical protein HIM_00516 [Hirsutella minnesotensis 3608]